MWLHCLNPSWWFGFRKDSGEGSYLIDLVHCRGEKFLGWTEMVSSMTTSSLLGEVAAWRGDG